MTAQRLETIKKACVAVYGTQCLNAKKTTQATNKADKALLKLVDSVLQSEYCNASADNDKLLELDFND